MNTALTNVLSGFIKSSTADQRRQAAARRNDRTARYMARVDEHIKGLGPKETMAFLNKELATWFERYRLFQIEVFSGREMKTLATAYDYIETISAISAKIGRLERQQAVK